MHVRLGDWEKKLTTNIIERLHGTPKERTKVMTGLDNEDSTNHN